MKAIIISDLHVKFNAPFARITSEGIDSRIKEILDTIKWAGEVGVKQGCKLFIITGDFFDAAQRLPTLEGIKVRDTLREVASKYSKVIALVGNHDMISDNENIMQLFDDIIEVVTEPTALTVQGARLSFLPYQRDKESLIAEMQRLGNVTTVDPHYLFAHFWLKAEIGNDPEAPDINELPHNLFEKIFTGHLHAPSKESLVDKSPVIYVGTALNKSFAEAGQKGAWVVDFTKKTYKFHANPFSPEFFNTTDNQIFELYKESVLRKTAYYKVECDPVNILEVTKILTGESLGFEIVNKVTPEYTPSVDASIVFAEKKNSATLKEFILGRAVEAYKPDTVTDEEFLAVGAQLLKDLS